MAVVISRCFLTKQINSTITLSPFLATLFWTLTLMTLTLLTLTLLTLTESPLVSSWSGHSNQLTPI